MTLEDLMADAFEPLVGAGWSVTADDGSAIPLELVEVQRLPARSGGPRRDPFTLQFKGPADPILSQATRTFRHQVGGSVVLFVVPVGRAADSRILYEVVVN